MLLRLCVSPMPLHLLQACSPASTTLCSTLCKEATTLFDQAFLRLLEIQESDTTPYDDTVMAQSRLQLGRGGDGFKDCLAIAPAAHLGSFAGLAYIRAPAGSDTCIVYIVYGMGIWIYLKVPRNHMYTGKIARISPVYANPAPSASGWPPWRKRYATAHTTGKLSKHWWDKIKKILDLWAAKGPEEISPGAGGEGGEQIAGVLDPHLAHTSRTKNMTVEAESSSF